MMQAARTMLAAGDYAAARQWLGEFHKIAPTEFQNLWVQEAAELSARL
jgi:hypothetical protein